MVSNFEWYQKLISTDHLYVFSEANEKKSETIYWSVEKLERFRISTTITHLLIIVNNKNDNVNNNNDAGGFRGR